MNPNKGQCLKCGLFEPAETLVDGFCQECIKLSSAINLRREIEKGIIDKAAKQILLRKNFVKKMFLRDKFVFAVGNLLLPCLCYLTGLIANSAELFILFSMIAFFAFEFIYEVHIDRLYLDALSRLSKFEREAVSQEEKNEVRKVIKGISEIKLMFLVNPRFWTDDEIEESLHNAPFFYRPFLSQRKGRLLYLRNWYKKNPEEANSEDLSIAVLRSANLYPSLIETFLRDDKMRGYAIKVFLFACLAALNPLNFAWL